MNHFAEDKESDFKEIPSDLGNLHSLSPPASATSIASDEKQALLAKTVRSYNATADPEKAVSGLTPRREEMQKALAKFGIEDTMMYKTNLLTTWDCFQIPMYSSLKNLTIWASPDLWRMMGFLGMVSAVSCFISIVAIPHPAAMQTAKFTAVSKFLNVVVGLLLGFFLSSSMNRWYSCVAGFLELLDAIRNMQMQFVALGVPEQETILCLRYAFASAWLLYGQLLVETKGLSITDEKELSDLHDEMWRRLCSKVAHIDKRELTFLLKEREADVLRKTRDPPGMMWMWVAALIGRLSQDGWIPPMASPTYGRVMNICQSGHAGIRQVRASISVQAPLTYTHMLASLVHINNLLNALTLGIVAGVAVGTWLIRNNMHIYTGHSASRREVTQDWQNMVVTFMYCFFGPLIYQALLLIGMHLAQPFDNEAEEAQIPLDRLLVQLEIDMCNGRDLVEHMPFDRPCFKQPPKPAAV